jgi:hypothetical protein
MPTTTSGKGRVLNTDVNQIRYRCLIAASAAKGGLSDETMLANKKSTAFMTG